MSCRSVWLALAVVIAACGPTEGDVSEQQPELGVAQYGLGTYAALAGISGTVTTLATYDNGAPHPGENSIDVGGSGTVYHQLDYLDSSIGGGFVQIFTDNTSPCSSQAPGSWYYNGQRVRVYTYFFSPSSVYLGYHREMYQHVEPNANVGNWFKWNKSGSSFWTYPNVIFNNTTSGGISVGSVYNVTHAVTLPSGTTCTTGTHLHQEGQSYRASQRTLGGSVTARYSDMHMFSSLSSGCGTLNYQGTCVGQTLLWCESNTVKYKDCAALGKVCRWQDSTIGYICG